MPQASVNIRMGENLKQDFDAVCSEMGLTMTVAFTEFTKAVTKKRVIPFDILADKLPNDITLASKKTFARDWLLPEEDEAWANL